jgi:selenocysteine lyase/cysteine desulfurase
MSTRADELDSKITQFRKLFPVTEECVYFNHAGTGPLSLPAREAVEHCIDTYARHAEFNLDDYFALLDEARMVVARLINAKPEEITFTHNTSEGVYIALANISLQPGDTILVMDKVFPAVRYIVDHNLPHIQKKYVSFSGKDPVDVVKRNTDGKVKAVVVDYVQFLSGETIDLARLSVLVREYGMYLVVDGIQAIGAIDYDVRTQDIDFLACGSAKWLFGPSGAGFLYVNKRNFSNLGSFHTGWLGAEWHGFEDCTLNPPLYKDARRFEIGTRNIMGIRAFSANINILLQYGMGNVEERIMRLKAMLRLSFEELGYEILTPEHGLQSGILTARPARDVRRVYDVLRESGVVLSLRNGYLRFSPHFYNTEEEVLRIIETIRRV